MHKAWNSHPNLLLWAALAAGMVIIVIFAARNVGFQAGQWAAIVGATTLLAGLCVWIVSWEDAGDGAPGDESSAAEEQAAGNGPANQRDTVTANAGAADAAHNGDV